MSISIFCLWSHRVINVCFRFVCYWSVVFSCTVTSRDHDSTKPEGWMEMFAVDHGAAKYRPFCYCFLYINNWPRPFNLFHKPHCPRRNSRVCWHCWNYHCLLLRLIFTASFCVAVPETRSFFVCVYLAVFLAAHCCSNQNHFFVPVHLYFLPFSWCLSLGKKGCFQAVRLNRSGGQESWTMVSWSLVCNPHCTALGSPLPPHCYAISPLLFCFGIPPPNPLHCLGTIWTSRPLPWQSVLVPSLCSFFLKDRRLQRKML